MGWRERLFGPRSWGPAIKTRAKYEDAGADLGSVLTTGTNLPTRICYMAGCGRDVPIGESRCVGGHPQL
jgi:hypothetical protein